MMEEMPYEELLKWVSFFKDRPFGWREDQRTLMIMKSFGFKGKGSDVFPSLRAMEQNRQANIDAGKVLPTGNFLEKMLKARNGDDSGWVPPWVNKQ